MVFLDKNNGKLVINRHSATECDSLQLINNFSNKVFIFNSLINTSDSSYFYEFTLDLSTLVDGEYTIRLLDEDENVIEEMIGVCGDYQVGRTSYQRQNNERKVYERGQNN